MLSQENDDLTKILVNNLHNLMMQILDFRNAEDKELVRRIVIFAQIW